MMKNKAIGLLLIALLWGSLGYSQSIDGLLQKAYKNNPSLAALLMEYEAILQQGPQVRQLPNPQVGFGLPVLRPETRLGAQTLGVSASQLFPWFGTLKTREDIVLYMAKSKYEQWTAERLEIDFQIKSAYYQLYLLEAKQQIIRQHIRIYEALEKVALAKIESGKSIASDVLKLRINIESLQQQLPLIDEEKQRYTAQINEATHQPIDGSITIQMPHLTVSSPTLDLSQYEQKIAANHPLIKALDWRIEASHKTVILNTLNGKPSLGVGVDYSRVSGRTDAFPIDNGRDILIPKVMVSIPLYRKKFTAKKKEETLKQDAMALQKESLTQKMMGRIQRFLSNYETAILRHELAQKQQTLSESAYEILLAEYRSNGNRFDELIALQNDRLRYEIDQVTAVVQSHLAQFNIDRYTDF